MNPQTNDHFNYTLTFSMMISELVYQAVMRIEDAIKALQRSAA
jgi:hypothetical protein